jgi:hypothetical protein
MRVDGRLLESRRIWNPNQTPVDECRARRDLYANIVTRKEGILVEVRLEG